MFFGTCYLLLWNVICISLLLKVYLFSMLMVKVKIEHKFSIEVKSITLKGQKNI